MMAPRRLCVVAMVLGALWSGCAAQSCAGLSPGNSNPTSSLVTFSSSGCSTQNQYGQSCRSYWVYNPSGSPIGILHNARVATDQTMNDPNWSTNEYGTWADYSQMSTRSGDGVGSYVAIGSQLNKAIQWYTPVSSEIYYAQQVMWNSGHIPTVPTMDVMAIFPNYVSAVTPNALPTYTGSDTYPLSLTVSFGFPSWASSSVMFGLAAGSCTTANIRAMTRLPSGQTSTTVSITMPAVHVAGTYALCMSPDSATTWLSQSSLTVTVAAVPTNLLTAPTQSVYDGVTFSTTLNTNGLANFNVLVALALASANSCDMKYITSIALTSPGTAVGVTFAAPASPGLYSYCVAWEGSTSFVAQTSAASKLTFYKATPYSIAAVTPSYWAANAAGRLVVTPSSIVGAGYMPCSGCNVALSPAADCNARPYVGPAGQTGPSYYIDIASNYITVPGAYYLCYTVNNWANKVATDGVLVTMLGTADTQITGVYPTSVGCNTAPVLRFATVGLIPPTASVRLATSPDTCAPLVSLPLGNTTVAFGAINPGSCSSTTTLYVCYALDASTGTYVNQPGVVVYVRGTNVISAVTPSVIASTAAPVFLFASPDIMIPPSTVKLVATATSCSSGGYTASVVGGPLTFTGIPAGVYDICYSVGNAFVLNKAAAITIVGNSPSALTWASGTTFVAFRDGQVLNITAGPPATTGAAVYLARSSIGCSAFSPLAVVPYTGAPMTVPIPTGATFNPGAALLCYTVDGVVANAVAQTGGFTMIADATSTTLTVTGGANFNVAPGSNIVMTIIGGVSSSNKIGFAPDGLCNCAMFTPAVAYTSPGIGLYTFVPPVLSGQRQYTIYPCLSILGGPYVSQKNAGLAVTVGVAIATSIDSLSPSSFIVGVPIQAGFNGAVATTTTMIALSSSNCATRLANCTASYTTSSSSLSLGASCSFPVAQTLRVCLSMDSGATWVLQSLVSAVITSDPYAGAITGISPTVLGVGTMPGLALSIGGAGTFGPGVYIGFTSTVCTSCNTTCEGLIPMASLSPTLTNPFVTAYPSWSVCFTRDYGQTWSQQVSFGVGMKTLKATSGSITSITPSVVGQGNTKVLALSGVEGAITSYIAFSTVSNCASVISGTIQNVPVGVTALSVSVSAANFTAAGTYTLCYSTNNTNTWVAQTPTLTVVVATATSISNQDITLIGEAVLTVLGLTFASQTYSVDTYVSFALNNCTTSTKLNPVQPTVGGSVTISTPLPAANYVLCLSTQGTTGTWVKQTAGTVYLNVIGTSTNSITSVTPSPIGVNTLPTLTIAGAVPSATTAVAFATASGYCGMDAYMLGVTRITSTNVVPLGQVLALANDALLYVCYTTNYGNGGANWKVQTPMLSVLTPSATAVSAVSPSIIGADVIATFTLSVVGGVTPSSQIGFSQTQGGCGSLAQRFATTQYYGSPMTITTAISVPGIYFACYSVDNGTTWTAQTTSSAQITVVKANSNSLSDIDPPVIGDGTILSLTLQGLQSTPTTRVSFSLNPTCGSGLVANTPVTTSGAITMTMSGSIPTAGEYTVCYSTSNGALWVPQMLVTLSVLSATPTSVHSIAPRFIGTKLALPLTLDGNLTTPLSVVSFALTGACAGGPWISVTPYSSTITLSSGITNPGVYDLCYSVRNGTAASWVAQSSPQTTLEAAVPSAYTVTSLFPNGMGAGTLPVFTVTASDVHLAPQTALAFVANGGDCNVAGQRLSPLAMSSWVPFGMPATINAGGIYQLCLTHNGIDWVRQLNSSATLTVVPATATSVQGVTPTLYQNGMAVKVTLTGVTFTTTSVFAFAVPGQCATTRLAQTAWVPDYTGGVDMASPLNTGAIAINLTICYSVNAGVTWVEQSALQVLVVTACDDMETMGSCDKCHKNPFCTWCLTENICAVNMNTTICPSATNVGPADPVGCPSLTFPSRMTGSDAGNSLVTIGSNGRFFNTDDLTCHWDFTVSTNETEFTVTSASQGWCRTPPGYPGVAIAYITLRYRGVPFASTSASQPAFWSYYDCEQRYSPLCVDCYNLAKPECGTCFETGACQASFQCRGLFGGTQCPTITGIEPAQINFRGYEEITVYGSLFVNSSSLSCHFGSDEVYANATFINETAITCVAPPFDANTVVQISLMDRGLLYTHTVASLLYVADPVPAAIIQPPAPVAPDHLTIPLVTTIVVLVCVALIILVVVLHRRRKARQALMPPDLTAALTEAIIFGEFKASPNVKQIAPHVNPLMELLLIPNSPILDAVVRVTESTEADMVSRALVYVTESRLRTVDVMKHLVTLEVKVADSMYTLFRTNSFVTKMFKVYSKIVGLEYVHSTLGYELNASLHSAHAGEGEDASGLDVRDDSADDVQLNKLILLTVCQRVLLAITKNEKDVPNQFRELFAHIKTCMQARFPASNESLARLTAGNLSATLVETRAAMTSEGPLTVNDINALQMVLVNGLAGDNMDPNTQSKLKGLSGGVEQLTTQLMATLKACKDMEASMYPDSEEARRVVAEHNQAQNAIAVGGFFFLRFLVPAITAPDAYALVRETPDANTIKTLILCGKVLQNLSNDKEMGGKEAHLAKMNEFIVSNRKVMQKFQGHLMVKRENDSGAYAPVPVPQRHIDAASVYLYEFISSRFKNIMAQLDTPQPGEDASAALTRTQMANMLVHVLGAVHSQAGEFAHKPRSATDSFESVTSARRGNSASSAVSTTQLTLIRLDDAATGSMVSVGDPVAPASVGTDTGAGLSGTPSMMGDIATANPVFSTGAANNKDDPLFN